MRTRLPAAELRFAAAIVHDSSSFCPMVPTRSRPRPTTLSTPRRWKIGRLHSPRTRRRLSCGSLALWPVVGLQDRIDRAKAKGTWVDYKQCFGKQPPRWHLTDAKGLAKTAELSDLKGEWVVLYFWSPSCPPCLGKQLPELMTFYENHKAERADFEVLAFCCDFEERLKSIAELEKELAAVQKAVWGGKDLPFPVLLDNTFQTYERFGLEGSGVSNLLLIDPEGKLVEGDLKTLAAQLERHVQKSP